MHTLTRRRSTDDGFTLIEVIFALVILIIVLVATGSAFTQALALERHTTNLNRARTLAESTLAWVEPMSVPAVGHYSNDPYPYSVTLPSTICQKDPSTGNCIAEKTVAIAATRPASTSSGRIVPPVTAAFTFDGDAAAVTKKLAQRVYNVKFYVTSGGLSTTHGVQAHQDRKISAVVTWLENGQTKTFALARFLHSQTDGRCQQYAWRASGSDPFPDTSPDPDAPDGSLNYCVKYTLTPVTTSASLPAGEYRFSISGRSMPVTTAGAPNAKLRWDVRLFPAVRTTSSSRYQFLSVTSVKLKLFAGTEVTMTPNATTSTWSYTGTVPSGISTKQSTVTFTFSDGSTTKRVIDYLPRNPAFKAAVGSINLGMVNTLPFTVASGGLRWNVNDASSGVTGTSVTRLCTKADGTLWKGQHLYLTVTGGNQAVTWGSSEFGTRIYASWLGNAPSATTAAPKWGWYDEANRFTQLGVKQADGSVNHTGVSDVGVMFDLNAVTSGSSTAGAFQTQRWRIFLPSTADLASQSPKPVAPRFLSSKIDVFVAAHRVGDKKIAYNMIRVPVYRSSTGLDCPSGNTSQPTYPAAPTEWWAVPDWGWEMEP